MSLNILYNKKTEKNKIKESSDFVRTEISLAFLLTFPFVLLADLGKLINSSNIFIVYSFILTTLVYSVFLFFIGYKIYKTNLSSKELATWGVKFLGLGLFLNVVCNVAVRFISGLVNRAADISSCGFLAVSGSLLIACALIYFAFAIFKKLKLSVIAIAVISFVLVVISSLIVCFYVDSYVINQLMSYFIPSASMGFFPLFCCLIFSAAGYVFASAEKRIKNINNFYIAVFIVSMFVLTIFIVIASILSVNYLSNNYVDLNATSFMPKTRYKVSLGFFWPDALFCIMDLFFVGIWFSVLRFITSFFGEKVKKGINNIAKNFEIVFAVATLISAVAAICFALFKLSNISSHIIILISFAITIVAFLLFYKYATQETYNNKIVVWYRKNYIKIAVVLAIIAIALFVYSLLCTPPTMVHYSADYMQTLLDNMNAL